MMHDGSEFLFFPRCVALTHTYKLQNISATIYIQKFRQINFLLKDFTANQFDENKIA